SRMPAFASSSLYLPISVRIFVSGKAPDSDFFDAFTTTITLMASLSNSDVVPSPIQSGSICTSIEDVENRHGLRFFIQGAWPARGTSFFGSMVFFSAGKNGSYEGLSPRIRTVPAAHPLAFPEPRALVVRGLR